MACLTCSPSKLMSPPQLGPGEPLYCLFSLNTSLSPRVRELIILRVATLNNAPYEFDAHVPHALAAGMPEALAAVVSDGKALGGSPTAHAR